MITVLLHRITTKWRSWQTELWLGVGFSLLVIAGESKLRFAIILLAVGIAIVHRKSIDWSAFIKNHLLWFGAWLWLLTQLISTVWSIHLPASFQAVTLPLSTILVLWVVVGLRQQWLWRQRLVFVASWVLSALGIVQIALWFLRPESLIHLPRLNYLYNNFGHSHFATLLLLFLPYTMIQIVAPPVKRYRLPVWVGVWMLVLMGFAFSRVIMALAVAMLIILFIQLRLQINKKFLYRFLPLLVFLVCVAVAKQLMSTTEVEQVLCDQHLLVEQHCQEQRQELRWFYWQQAWQVFRHTPWFGIGPGTFPYGARVFVQEMGANTAYAHNWILAALAETGIIGLIGLIGFMVASFITVLSQPSREHWQVVTRNLMLFFWFLALFDFDNQLFVIWTVFIVLIGLSARQPTQSFRSGALRLVVPFVMQLAVTGWLIFYSALLTVFQIASPALKKNLLATLPIAVLPLEIKVDQSWLQLSNFMRWYDHDSDMLFQLATVSDETNHQHLLAKVAQLDPWRGVMTQQFSAARNMDMAAAQTTLERYWQFYYHHWLTGRGVTAEISAALADAFYEQGKREYQAQNYEVSAQWLVRAYRAEPWVLSRNQPFIDVASVTKDMWVFSKPLLSFNRDMFGDNQAVYTEYLNTIIMIAAQAASTDLATVTDQRMQEKISDTEYSSYLLTQCQKLISMNASAYRALPTKDERSPYMVDSLVEATIATAEYSVGHGINKTSQLYGSALRLKPWAMNGKKWWFQIRPIDEKSSEDMFEFIDNWQPWHGDSIGYDPIAFRDLVRTAREQTNPLTQARRYRRYSEIIQLLEQEKNDDT